MFLAHRKEKNGGSGGLVGVQRLFLRIYCPPCKLLVGNGALCFRAPAKIRAQMKPDGPGRFYGVTGELQVFRPHPEEICFKVV